MDTPSETYMLAIPWYYRNNFQELRALADDRAELPFTYSEWHVRAAAVVLPIAECRPSDSARYRATRSAIEMAVEDGPDQHLIGATFVRRSMRDLAGQANFRKAVLAFQPQSIRSLARRLGCNFEDLFEPLVRAGSLSPPS